MKRVLVAMIPVAALTLAEAVLVAGVLTDARLSEVARTAIVTGSLGTYGTLTAAYGGWSFAAARDNSQRAHEWRMAHAERLYERRAAAYEDVLAHFAQQEQILEETLPFIGTANRSPDPFGDMSPREWDAHLKRIHEHGSRLVAKIVAYGSPKVRELTSGVTPILADFWANVYAYRVAARRDDPVTDFYVKAHEIRKRFATALHEMQEQVASELLDPPLIAPAGG